MINTHLQNECTDIGSHCAISFMDIFKVTKSIHSISLIIAAKSERYIQLLKFVKTS